MTISRLPQEANETDISYVDRKVRQYSDWIQEEARRQARNSNYNLEEWKEQLGVSTVSAALSHARNSREGSGHDSGRRRQSRS